MPRLFYVAITAASIIAAAASGPAVAVPVDFVLDGASVTFSNGNTNTLTGTFTFDPTTATLTAINISESGPAPGPNSFTMPEQATASSFIGCNSIGVSCSLLSSQFLFIGFQNNLDSVSDPLSEVSTLPTFFDSFKVTGSADPVLAVTPIPPAVALFATALALFAFVLYRRNPRMGMSFASVQRFA